MALIGRIKGNKLYIKGEIIEGNDHIRIENVGNIKLDEVIEGNNYISIEGKNIKINEVIEGDMNG